ncbi:MAG: Uma2 family endonuclease [Pyrinomonadaceae bacterium]
MSLQVAKHCFTVAEFERMGEAGIFREDARLELIEGEIVEMSPIGSRHAACIDLLARLLRRQVEDFAIIRVQSPIQLDDFSEPQPDIALLKLRDDFYRHAHPTPADVLLVIEVADTTVEYDRLVKVPLYAKAEIKEVWVINLPAERIEIYAEPLSGAYQIIREVKPGEEARAQSIAGLVVSASTTIGEIL